MGRWGDYEYWVKRFFFEPSKAEIDFQRKYGAESLEKLNELTIKNNNLTSRALYLFFKEEMKYE